MDFGTRIVISSHKPQGDDLARPRMFPVKARMLLSSRLTFPLASGTAITANRIKVRATAVQIAVVQYYDVDIADTYAVQKFSADLIQAVSNHNGFAGRLVMPPPCLRRNRRLGFLGLRLRGTLAADQ